MQTNFNDLSEHDKNQRQQALNTTLSFIVQAPAGSGKTELLIQRFLALLGQVNTPEEILAITFTKKAANEMRSRVIKALKFALTEEEPESAHAKQTWRLAKQALQRDQQFNWHILENPNQLRIQTIDALCAYFTKQLPMLSHFGSQPDIAINPLPLYREAVQEILAHVEENFAWSTSIAELLKHLDNDLNKLHDLLVNLLAKRDQWLGYIHLDINDEQIKNQLEKHLSAVVTEGLQRAYTAMPRALMADLMTIARFAAHNASISGLDTAIRACADLESFPLPEAKYQQAWRGLASLLLTKTFTWRKRVDEDIGFPALAGLKNPQEKSAHTLHRQRLSEIITTLSDREDLRLALMDLFYLPIAYYEDNQWAILQHLLNVLKIVAAQLRVTFQLHGQIDFIENTQAALFALGQEDHPTDLALALDYHLQHILIDEFQDTSSTQYQLLEKLVWEWQNGDGRTLFVVGDPMQSIYRFREAEVGLFIRMQKTGIANLTLIPLTLSVNFRSAPQIVDWNNTHFQQIFPARNDIATGAVTYSNSISNNAVDEHAHIAINGFSDDNAQAHHLTEIIKQTQLHHPHEKIAILVRSRTQLNDIIPALKKADIAFRAVDIDSLASRQIIQDLLSLSCALLHPADRIAWLSLLRSPYCGLTLSDLFIIAGDNPHTSIWERLEKANVIKQLSADGQTRLRKIFPILKMQIAERGRAGLREWIESTWLLLGGPASLIDYTDIDDANAFFELLNEVAGQHGAVNLDQLKEKINKLYAATQHDDSLQIMTIHTAKGLEFDTVILPHIQKKTPIDDKPLLLWAERLLDQDKTALLLAPLHGTGNDKDGIYEFIYRQQRIKLMHEMDRLLYVAATRAKRRLHLLFDITAKDGGNFRVESGSFLEKIWPFIANRSHEYIAHSNQELATLKTENPRFFTRLTSDWQNPIRAIPSTFAAHQQQDGFVLPEVKARVMGIVLHQTLQHISQLGSIWWTSKNDVSQKQYITQQLQQTGLPPHVMPAAVSFVANALTNTLNDPRGQWLLRPHTEARSEFALTAIIENKIENLILDRTFVDENNVRWIIDYKTTTLTHDDLAVFLQEEQEKYLQQMQKYQQAMQLIDKRPIKLGLYFPALPAWHEWEMT